VHRVMDESGGDAVGGSVCGGVGSAAMICASEMGEGDPRPSWAMARARMAHKPGGHRQAGAGGCASSALARM